MRISTDRISHLYIDKLSPSTQEGKTVQKVREERNFDEVVISAGSRAAEEKKMTQGLVKDVLSQVYRQVPAERIQALKEAEADGSYRVDVDAVARRMLTTEVEKDNG